MMMAGDVEDVNNDKPYDEDTCDVHIDKARFDNVVSGYACKGYVDYKNEKDVAVQFCVHYDDDDDDPNDDKRIYTCLQRL